MQPLLPVRSTVSDKFIDTRDYIDSTAGISSSYIHFSSVIVKICPQSLALPLEHFLLALECALLPLKLPACILIFSASDFVLVLKLHLCSFQATALSLLSVP